MAVDASVVKLFIGGLSYGTTDESLGSYFRSYGTVRDVTVMTDPSTKKSRGFGFVHIVFNDLGDLDQIITGGKIEIDGRACEVKRATPHAVKDGRSSSNFVGNNSIWNDNLGEPSQSTSERGSPNDATLNSSRGASKSALRLQPTKSTSSLGGIDSPSSGSSPQTVTTSAWGKPRTGMGVSSLISTPRVNIVGADSVKEKSFSSTSSEVPAAVNGFSQIKSLKVPTSSTLTPPLPASSSNTSTPLFSGAVAASRTPNSSSLPSSPALGVNVTTSYRKIFVGGLHYGTDEAGLKEYFSQFGQIASAEVLYNHETSKSRGFGFVVFADTPEGGAEAVRRVMERGQYHVVDGKNVEVKQSIPKANSAAPPTPLLGSTMTMSPRPHSDSSGMDMDISPTMLQSHSPSMSPPLPSPALPILSNPLVSSNSNRSTSISAWSLQSSLGDKGRQVPSSSFHLSDGSVGDSSPDHPISQNSGHLYDELSQKGSLLDEDGDLTELLSSHHSDIVGDSDSNSISRAVSVLSAPKNGSGIGSSASSVPNSTPQSPQSTWSMSRSEQVSNSNGARLRSISGTSEFSSPYLGPSALSGNVDHVPTESIFSSSGGVWGSDSFGFDSFQPLSTNVDNESAGRGASRGLLPFSTGSDSVPDLHSIDQSLLNMLSDESSTGFLSAAMDSVKLSDTSNSFPQGGLLATPTSNFGFRSSHSISNSLDLLQSGGVPGSNSQGVSIALSRPASIGSSGYNPPPGFSTGGLNQNSVNSNNGNTLHPGMNMNAGVGNGIMNPNALPFSLPPGMLNDLELLAQMQRMSNSHSSSNQNSNGTGIGSQNMKGLPHHMLGYPPSLAGNPSLQNNMNANLNSNPMGSSSNGFQNNGLPPAMGPPVGMNLGNMTFGMQNGANSASFANLFRPNQQQVEPLMQFQQMLSSVMIQQQNARR